MINNVLVTGANGFVGYEVSRILAGSGRKIRGMTRTSTAVLPAGVERAVASDLQNRDAVRSCMIGIDAVVHLAARAHITCDTSADPLAEYRRTNVEGTRVLLEEAAAAGVGKFIFLSSVKAVGETNTLPWNEDVLPEPRSLYGISKLEAEIAVNELASGFGISACILRLPLVYGPRLGANMLRLFDLVHRGIPLPFARVDNRRSLVHTGNVAEAIGCILVGEGMANETFFVSDGQDLSTSQLIRLIAVALDRPARLFPASQFSLRLAGRLGDVIGAVSPIALSTPTVQRLLDSLTVDSAKIGRVTGFRPRYSVSDGLAVTAQWYKDRIGNQSAAGDHR